MFTEDDSSNRKKMNGCFFAPIIPPNLSWVLGFVFTQERVNLPRFHLKANRKKELKFLPKGY